MVWYSILTLNPKPSSFISANNLTLIEPFSISCSSLQTDAPSVVNLMIQQKAPAGFRGEPGEAESLQDLLNPKP